jgi:hypothetical protein
LPKAIVCIIACIGSVAEALCVAVSINERAGLLKRPIRINELGSNRATVGMTFVHLHQGLEPVRRNDDVVVHETNETCTRRFRADVVAFAEKPVRLQANKAKRP